MPSHVLGGLTRIVTERRRDGTQLLELFERGVPQAELILPVSACGTAVENLTASASKRWVVTHRYSGQGEWGYDVIDMKTFERVGGVAERKGTMLDLPLFDADETRVVGGYGSAWLGGWWAHPDDEPDEPARGGRISIGWLFDHDLADNHVSWHELFVDVPAQWLPHDPWNMPGPP